MWHVSKRSHSGIEREKMKKSKERVMPTMEEPTIFTDKYRIAALDRGNCAHIDWTSNHQNLSRGFKPGDEIWVYGETPPHYGTLCTIQKIEIKPIKRYSDQVKISVCAK